MSNSRLLTGLALALLAGLVGSAAATPPTLSLPPRPAAAKTGTQFKDEILNLARDARELAIYREITAGNVPNFIRNLTTVTLSATIASQPRTAVVYVTPEYMAVGSDVDYFRIPMTPILAQWVADATSCSLPTRKIVNATWTAAPVKLNPSPIPPSGAMVTVPVFWDHQVTVQAQRDADPAPLGTLVGGHKKDVIITPRLHDSATPKRVAIYGWHQSNGSPIQGIYLGHGETYADYSHGIRLVSQHVLLDGVTTASVAGILTDATLRPLLHDEPTYFGPTAPPRYSVPPPPTTSATSEWKAF